MLNFKFLRKEILDVSLSRPDWKINYHRSIKNFGLIKMNAQITK